MPVKLYGRSHPAHNAARMVYHTDHGPCGCQGINELTGPSRGHSFKGLICQSSLKSFKVLGRQVSKVEGDPGLIMRFKVLEGHSEYMFSKVFQSRGFRLPRVKGFQDM